MRGYEERRTQRFGLKLSPVERRALEQLARHERLPAAAVVRRLIWREVEAVKARIEGGNGV
jgi:hypothetical protein